jgi:hypothetical protein
MKESLPAKWDEGIICPIYKKGDCLRCGDYGGITLLNIVYKVFSVILCERLRPKIEVISGGYETGFGEGKGTIGQMHTFWQIMERMKEQNISTYYLFIIRDGRLDIRGIIYIRILQLPAYADNLVIVGRTYRNERSPYGAGCISARKMGVAKNEERTLSMEMSEKAAA